MVASDCLFAAVYLICLMLHCIGYCINPVKRDDFEKDKEFEQMSKAKALFE
jgi:hypothetical protein